MCLSPNHDQNFSDECPGGTAWGGLEGLRGHKRGVSMGFK